MRRDSVVPVEDPWNSSQEQPEQGQDFAALRARALSLARALSSPSPSSSPSLATDVEILASQVLALHAIDADDNLRAEEGWLVAAVADLRARVRFLNLGGGGSGDEATATASVTTTATPTRAAAAFAPALSQRFERTTLKFFMPESGSNCLASRKLRLELGRAMALAGPSNRTRLGFPREEDEEEKEGEEPCVASSSSMASSSSSASAASSSSFSTDFSFDGRVTSVYFDEPPSLPALTSRGLRIDGASLVRARYYGRKEGALGAAAKAAKAAAVSPSSAVAAATRKESDAESDNKSDGDCGASLASTALSPPTIWLERKVHRDASISGGKRSFKERIALSGAEAAALVAALPCRSPSCSSSSSFSSSTSPHLSSLASTALRVALGPGAVPLLRTEAERTAFEGERGLRVTVDERVRMSAVVDGKGGWLFDDEEEDGEGSRRLLFPFTIVEVKLAGSPDQAVPSWLESLLADPSLAVARAPRFSKALHAMAALSMEGLLLPLPAAAEAALPEVSRALLLAAGARAKSVKSFAAKSSFSKSASSFAVCGNGAAHRSTASLPAAAAGACASYAAATACNSSSSFAAADFDVEANGGGVGAVVVAAATTLGSSSPRPPPSSVFFAAAATSVSSSSLNGNVNTRGGTIAIAVAAAAEESPLPPPKSLPPIRTSTRGGARGLAALAAFSTAARAGVVAAAAAILQQQQQKRRQRNRKSNRQRGEGAPSNSPAAGLRPPPLLPTSFARSALYKVEPKVFFSAERSLLAYLQAALLIMILSTSLIGGRAGKEGGGALSPPSSSSSSSSSERLLLSAAIVGGVVSPAAICFILYALFVFRRRTRRMNEAGRGSIGFGATAASGGGGAVSSTAGPTTAESFDDSKGATALVCIAVVAGVATIAAAFAGGLFHVV